MNTEKVLDLNAENAVSSYESHTSILKAMLNDLEAPSEDGEVDKYSDEAYDALLEFPLCIDEYRTLDIVLGTGGPDNRLKVTLAKDDEILSMSFEFRDWGYFKDFEIFEDTDEWNKWSQFVEMFIVH
jgi:hypothetical protein